MVVPRRPVRESGPLCDRGASPLRLQQTPCPREPELQTGGAGAICIGFHSEAKPPQPSPDRGPRGKQTDIKLYGVGTVPTRSLADVLKVLSGQPRASRAVGRGTGGWVDEELGRGEPPPDLRTVWSSKRQGLPVCVLNPDFRFSPRGLLWRSALGRREGAAGPHRHSEGFVAGLSQSPKKGEWRERNQGPETDSPQGQRGDANAPAQPD